MKKSFYLFFVLTMLITSNTLAQVSSYTFSQSSGSYTAITGGTVVATATANSGAGSLDDITYNVPSSTIPFTFTFDGVGYTGLNINTNGFITFGATAPSGATYSPISGTTAYAGCIAPFGRDLNAYFAVSGYTGEIRYETVGSSPNQEFVIQWTAFRPYSTSTSLSLLLNFQIRLHENNSMKVVYDVSPTTVTTSSAQVGLRGPNNTFPANINNRLITAGTHTWATSAAGTANSSVCAYSSSLLPASGQTYLWSPPVALDMGALALVSPGTTGCYGSNQTVTVQIKNFGTALVDFSVNPCTVSASVSGPNPQVFSSVVLNSGTLASNATQDVQITTTYNMSAVGTYTFNASTSVTGDGNAGNDAMVPVNRVLASPVSLPQTVDFTSFTGADLTTVFPNWYEAAGATLPSGTTSLWLNASGWSPANTSAKINLYTTTRQEWIVGPKFTVTATTKLYYSIAITDFAAYTADPSGMQGTDDRVVVKISTDCGASFNDLFTHNSSNTGSISNTFVPQQIDLGTTYNGQDVIIAFWATDGPTDDTPDYDFHIDDIFIGNPPTCPAPSALTATNITTNSADLGWTENGTATTWDIELGLFGFTPTGTPTQAGVTSNPYTYSLSSSTNYSFYVRSDCGAKEETSTWVGPYSFQTLCEPISSLPWTEGFEGVTIPALPTCWLKENGDWVTTDNANSAYDANAHSGTQFLRDAWSATNEFVWSPGFQLASGTSYDFSFWWAGDGYDEWDGDVWVNSTQNSSGATQLGTAFVVNTTTTTTTYEHKTYSFTPSSNGTYYFAIRVNGTVNPWYLSFDDFSVDVTPPYVDAEVTAILSPGTSETLGSAVTPQVTVKNNSEQTKNVPVTVEIWELPSGSKPITEAANLTPVEPISVDVSFTKEGVNKEDVNEKGEKSFIYFPSPNLNKAALSGELLAQDFSDVTFPPTGWARVQTNTGTQGGYSCYWDRLTAYYNSSPSAAGVWWSYNYQDEWLISPSVTLTGSPTGGYELKWYYYGYKGSTYGDHYYTKISTDGGTTWTVLYDLSAQTGGWAYWTDPVTINLNAYAGQTVKIAFHAEDPVTDDGLWYAWLIDDVEIGYGPAMVYSQNTTVTGLGSGASSSPTFPNWTATPSGNYQVKAYTSLSTEDMNPGNDLMTKNFQVVTTLNLTAFIEGFTNPGGTSMISDTVQVELHNASSPYEKIGGTKTVLNSSGVGTAYINAGANSVNYYVVVKHRNAVETWSGSTPQFSGGVMSYDFTSAQSQAYGSNMMQKGTKWCIFSGDVNQDGNVDLSDLIEVDNDNANFVTGYVPSDVNGDDSSDLSDMIIVDNNNAAFVGKVTP